MELELTLQSGQSYDHIRSGQMTPAMAAEYLRDGRVRVRNFGETLGQLYPGPDLQARLTAAFQGERDGLSAESAGRRVRSWLSGQNQPVNREDIFRIAFALGLGEGDASFLLGLCTDYGIHYREGRDVVYAWFFAHRAQLRRGPGLFRHPPPCARSRRRRGPTSPGSCKTCSRAPRPQRSCGIAIWPAWTGLARCTRGRTSISRSTWTSWCTRPSLGRSREPDYSMEAIMQQYFSLHIPFGRSRQGYSVVQKLIKHNWPNATALKNIRQHREDVPRKLLLLLYVVTENVIDGEYSEMGEDYRQPAWRAAS